MYWYLQPKNAFGKDLGLLAQSKNDSEQAYRLDKGSETGVMPLMHSFLRQHQGDMDPVEIVMYGPSTSNQVCVLFYVMQCVSRTKVLEL